MRNEVTLVFDERCLPVGVVTGLEVGRRRTGALGGVAADACARPDATSIGLIGAGQQAFTQFWAIALVRDLRLVYDFTRSSERSVAFAERVRCELGLVGELVEVRRARSPGATSLSWQRRRQNG